MTDTLDFNIQVTLLQSEVFWGNVGIKKILEKATHTDTLELINVPLLFPVFNNIFFEDHLEQNIGTYSFIILPFKFIKKLGRSKNQMNIKKKIHYF